jgi:hypothetical protein
MGIIEYEEEEAETVLAAVRTASSGSCPQPPDTMDGTSDGGFVGGAVDAMQCIDPGEAALRCASILDDNKLLSRSKPTATASSLGLGDTAILDDLFETCAVLDRSGRRQSTT